jgi:NifU-like protein involved in Fe-S cluster formation
MAGDPYNPVVRAAFENPVHAGDLAGEYACKGRASVSSAEHGEKLELSAGIDDGKIAEIRFRVWGCPHLVAAAEQVCAKLEGQAVGALGDIRANDLMSALSVPVTKLGRMLLVEDALQALGRELELD